MKRNSIFYTLIAVLIMIIIFMAIQIININNKYDEVQLTLSTNIKEKNDLKEKITNINYSADIESINAEIVEISNELNTLKENKENAQYENSISTLQTNIEELNKKYNSLPNYSKDIDNLKKQINDINKNNSVPPSTSATQSVDTRLIKKWKTTVETLGHSPESNSNIIYTTVYEFKENGDFYINDKKVGTYSNNDIFYKNLEREDYHVGNYYFSGNTLYINIYLANDIIYGSTLFYKCESI